MKMHAAMGFSLMLMCAGCAEEPAQDTGSTESSTETGEAPRCEDALTNAACNGLIPEQGQECVWVDVWSSPGTCEGGTTESRCITLEYQGNGCTVAYACGVEEEGPNAYFRNLGEAGVEVFLVEACEYQPSDGWQQCGWDNGEVTPHETCACSC